MKLSFVFNHLDENGTEKASIHANPSQNHRGREIRQWVERFCGEVEGRCGRKYGEIGGRMD